MPAATDTVRTGTGAAASVLADTHEWHDDGGLQRSTRRAKIESGVSGKSPCHPSAAFYRTLHPSHRLLRARVAQVGEVGRYCRHRRPAAKRTKDVAAHVLILPQAREFGQQPGGAGRWWSST